MASKKVFLEKVLALRPDMAGSDEKEKVAISSLVSETSKMGSDIKALDAKLTPITYLHSLQPTLADVALYTELHQEMSRMDREGYYSLPAVTRYYNHIQHLQSVNEARTLLRDTPFLLVSFDLDNMPPIERKVEVKEKKPKKEVAKAVETDGKKAKAAGEKPAPASQPEDKPQTSGEAAPADQSKKEKKDKKDKKEKAPQSSEGKKAKPAAEPAASPSPSMIDLRVGKVLEVSRHPDADSLYVEKIDIGEETGPRTVCSGLVKYMKEEDILGQSLVIVCNLKPATMRGVKSYAMLLCASSADGKDGGLEFVKPPAESQPGERIYFDGEKYENQTPEAQLNPKKKIFETIQPNFTTLDTLEACWIDPETKSVHKIRTQHGVCKVATLVGASLS